MTPTMPEQTLRNFASEKLYTDKLKQTRFWHTLVDDLVTSWAQCLPGRSDGFAHKVSK